MKRKGKITVGVASILSVLLLLLHGGIGARRVRGAGLASEMTALKNLDQLKQTFVRDQGRVRVLALLSPV